MTHKVEAKVVELRQVDNQVFGTLELVQIDDYRIPWYQKGTKLSSSFVSSINIATGDRIFFLARLKHKRRRVNFGVRDARVYDFIHQVRFSSSTIKELDIVSQQRAPVSQYRQWLDERLNTLHLYGVYKALLSADRTSIDPHHYDLFKVTGTIHLLAISGLHIALIYAMFYYSLKMSAIVFTALCRIPTSQTINFNNYFAAASLLMSGGFVALCEFVPSAQRAWIMLSVFVILFYMKRQYSLIHSLIIALCSLLIVNPFSLLDLGMWFSFIAVAAIFIALHLLRHRHLVTRYIGIQIYLFLILAPLSMWAFGGISVVQVGFNLVAVLFVSFLLMPLLLFDAVIGFGGLPHTLLIVTDDLLYQLIQWLLPYRDSYWFTTGQIPLWGVMLLYIGMLAVFITGRFWPVLYALACCLIYSGSKTLATEQWRADILDVGHGLSVVISRNGRALVYDLGPNYFGRYSIVNNTLLPHIQTRRLAVEHTIISHQDNDHSGGLSHWLAQGMGPSLDFFHSTSSALCENKTLYWQGLTVRVIWPKPNLTSGHNTNSESCVVLISDNKHSFLLTGDIGNEQEYKLVELGLLQPVDVVISPHHGSKTSSSEAFIQAVSPTHVIHSSSERLNWQMPHPDVTARYQDVKATQWLTKRDGGIKVLFYSDKVVVETAKEHKNYWFITD
ncbi:DNA internalization-related competence protein ComEC/Rec2 [Pseudoalteromonas sp. SSDWG2]|uniref:DNA internalization-related competence protein ComEC/Rec2 n=1 Tax=Pseudoalteromonas sp. SSDWG2 TaxID=3139391 RepID=UPI003BAA7A0C